MSSPGSLSALRQPFALRLAALRRLSAAIIGGDDERSVLRRSAASAFAIRVLSAAIAYLSQIFLARLLGQYDYGVFAYVWVWVIILGHSTCFGFGQSATRFVARYQAKSEPDLLHGYLAFSQAVAFAGSVLVAALGALGLYLFEDLVASHYILPLYLAAICVPIFALGDMQEGIARGFGWINTALAPPYLIRPVLLMAGLTLAWALGAQVNAATAMAVAIGATLGAMIVQIILVRRKVATVTKAAAKRGFKSRYWLAAALPLILVDSFALLQTYTDLLVLNLYVPPDQLAIYFATAKTIGLISFIPFAVATAAQAKFSAYHAAGDRQELADFVTATTHWTFWPALAACAGILALGYPLLWLFGADFTAGYPLMFILAGGILVHASTGQAEYLLNMLGHQNKVAVVLFATLFANLVLNFALVPIWGLTGAAIATAITFALQGLVFAAVARRVEGLETWLVPLSLQNKVVKTKWKTNK